MNMHKHFYSMYCTVCSLKGSKWVILKYKDLVFNILEESLSALTKNEKDEKEDQYDGLSHIWCASTEREKGNVIMCKK